MCETFLSVMFAFAVTTLVLWYWFNYHNFMHYPGHITSSNASPSTLLVALWLGFVLALIDQSVSIMRLTERNAILFKFNDKLCSSRK